MKIQIDFKNKTIKLENSVNMGEFMNRISEMFEDWEEFRLVTNTTITWSSPIVVKEYPRHDWWWSKPYWWTSETTPLFQSSSASGVLNFQL